MLRQAFDLRRCRLHAADGEIGHAADLYFDDQDWSVRYLVADTGGWLTGKLVLISPASIGRIDADTRAVEVRLTREQIRQSPDIETDRPVSRQRQIQLHEYYGWPVYWPTGVAPMGAGLSPGFPGEVTPPIASRREVDQEELGDPHLRSARHVAGYAIAARDGDIGHVEDFLFDDEAWALRYLIVDTRNWLPGKKVLVALPWVGRISWAESIVTVDFGRDEIKTAPAYDPLRAFELEDEERLFEHYHRPIGTR